MATDDVLATALRTDDLDATVKTIQDALGIKTGDIAGLFLGGKENRRRYAALLNSYRRAEFIKSWLCGELDDAAERVGRGGAR